MKKQMLTLVIGILIGAIIATGVFLVLQSSNSSSSNSSETFEMPSGNMGNFDENTIGERGERPDDMGGVSDNGAE